jgi:hypothetical protein
MAQPSTLQTIVGNLRDAAVSFVAPYRNPGTRASALRSLVRELGIADPQDVVSTALASAVDTWANIADQLSGVNLDLLNPAGVLADLQNKGRAVTDGIERIQKTAADSVGTLTGIGTAVATVLPQRLLDCLIFEFLTKSHEKIAGIFLLFGILRREFTPAGGNPAFVDADLRVFDLAQLVEVLTHPREAILKALRWGTNEFNARPAVDGLVLLLGTIPASGVARGPEGDTFPLSGGQYSEDQFVTVDAGVKPSARRTLNVPGLPGGVTTLEFVGLHRHGLGLLVRNPVSLSGGFGALEVPQLPDSQIFALTPRPDSARDPEFKTLSRT